MPASRQTSLLAGFFLLFLLCLTGCQTARQSQQLQLNPPPIAAKHLIAQVPFYPQQDYFCGPTTLAEVANFYGLGVTPDAIAPATFIPGLQGTLQIEMAAATRQLGMVAYAQHGSLAQLLALVSEDIPVIVLQNNALAWLPQWHYAVVIGYDLASQELLLHSGETAAHRLNFATFEHTWRRANYWFLAMLPATKTSAHLDPFIYTKACHDLLNTQQTAAAVNALVSATQQWPDYWLPYFLLGNHYYQTQPQEAANWFGKGLTVAQGEVSYLNNYAILLSELGCDDKATTLINAALNLAPEDANLLDSQQQILAAATTLANKPRMCLVE